MTPVETSLAALRAGLASGQVSSTGLVAAYLTRIAKFDRQGIALNALTVLDPTMFAQARASDLRRLRGESLGPLDGIPYTAKASFKARGLPADAGSPAFARLIAQEDAFAIARMRAAGAVLIGLTNMPPMANGGMQRGLHGRAESPYNADWLTAAFASGSSNGSGTATAASFAAFGLGEETWSSGRAPAANNGLCAYTPSRGLISVRGNWPLVPTMDVVVPQARSMADLLDLLDVLIVDDAETRGDLWRSQPWIALPRPSAIRPASFPALAGGASLRGKRLGVPALYINADPLAGTAANPGIGGPTGQRIDTRASIMALWAQARTALEAAGAEVVVVDFPLVSNYEGDRPGCPTIATRGLVPPAYLRRELADLSVWAWDDFLRANGDPGLNRLAEVEAGRIFPRPKGSLPDRYTGFTDDIADYPAHARAHPCTDFRAIADLEAGLRGLEESRRIDLEDWMDRLGLDAVVFPALADIAPADADTCPASADLAWRNGTWIANGNLAIRHFGIPTVTVPMGMMADTGLPAGLTFAGRGWDDLRLLQLACGFEATGAYRQAPPRTPSLAPLPQFPASGTAPAPLLQAKATYLAPDRLRLEIVWTAQSPLRYSSCNGVPVPVTSPLEVRHTARRHSEFLPAHGPLLLALFEDGQAAFTEVALPDPPLS